MRQVVAEPVAPSAVGLPNGRYFATRRALTESEILQIIEQFAWPSGLAQRAGFAGVQIHAAHGYLLSQFLSANVNRRADRWGGSLANRSRLLLSVLDRVREVVSAGFAVGVKLNAGDFVKGGLEPSEATHVMRSLEQRGIDFIEISGGTFERPASFGYGLPESTARREGYFLELAKRARDATTVPLIVTGGFRTSAGMENALASGACDLIGLARPLALEPGLPDRLLCDPAAKALQADLRLPNGALASLAELYWYREQLDRICRRKAPRTKGSGLLSILRRLPADRLSAWSRKRFTSRPRTH